MDVSDATGDGNNTGRSDEIEDLTQLFLRSVIATVPSSVVTTVT